LLGGAARTTLWSKGGDGCGFGHGAGRRRVGRERRGEVSKSTGVGKKQLETEYIFVYPDSYVKPEKLSKIRGEGVGREGKHTKQL